VPNLICLAAIVIVRATVWRYSSVLDNGHRPDISVQNRFRVEKQQDWIIKSRIAACRFSVPMRCLTA
jgi:hypothetical protein